jgi:hypothetical protein
VSRRRSAGLWLDHLGPGAYHHTDPATSTTWLLERVQGHSRHEPRQWWRWRSEVSTQEHSVRHYPRLTDAAAGLTRYLDTRQYTVGYGWIGDV